MAQRKIIAVETLEALGRKAVEAGNQLDMWRDRDAVRRLIRWDISGSCSNAVPVELHARYSAQHGKKVKPMTVVLETKCRRCGWCLDQRRKEWAERARMEYVQAVRTWFLTLTLTPEEQFRALTQARQDMQKQGVDFDGLTDMEKFGLRVRVIGEDITKFIKRVRKNSGARIRYLLVAEPHETGAPHFHMLVHEVSDLQPVRKKVLKDAWVSGFSKAVLCDDPRGAVYLCKYLSKDARTRVRASFKYGGGEPMGHFIYDVGPHY